MAKFVIRPATAADCSDILRLIKVAGSTGSSRAGGGGWGLCLRQVPLSPPASLLASLWEQIAAPPTPFLSSWPAGVSLNFLFLSQELAKYEYMEEQVILTEKGNASVVGRAGNERPVPATLMAADIVPRCPFLQIC